MPPRGSPRPRGFDPGVRELRGSQPPGTAARCAAAREAAGSGAAPAPPSPATGAAGTADGVLQGDPFGRSVGGEAVRIAAHLTHLPVTNSAR